MEVVEGKTAADMGEFYRLHTATRKRLGVPVQPFRFFRNLWEILQPPGIASLLLARDGGKTIAGIVQLKFKDTVYYKFAASDRRSLAKNPNHLIIWRMIEDAQRDGLPLSRFRPHLHGRHGADAVEGEVGGRAEGLPLHLPGDSAGRAGSTRRATGRT